MFFDPEKVNRSAEAIVDAEGNSLSYGDLLDFASFFISHTRKRALIFILSENTIGSAAGYVACLQSDIVPLLLNCKTDRLLIENLIETYKPEFLWIPERLVADFNYKVICSKYDYTLVKTEFDSPVLHENLSLLLPTSGSTGSPKLVRHSYKNVLENAKNVASVFDIKPVDRVMAVLPIYYTMGLSVITSHLYAGATILLFNGNLTDAAFWKFLKEQKATNFTGVPYSFEILAKLRFFRMDLPHLKIISQGGGKLSNTLFTEFASYADKTGKKFIATYGQTEGTARMAYLPHEYAMIKTGSIGKAIPNGFLQLIDENGCDITEPEKEGELVYHGANVTMGYAVSDKDLQKGDERNEVLHTGDIAKMDKDGFFYIVGRTNRFLKLFGMRISLDELEQLISDEFLMETMCTGNDEKMNIYITKSDISEKVVEFIMRKTGLNQQSFEVSFKPALPRNEAGKIIYNMYAQNIN